MRSQHAIDLFVPGTGRLLSLYLRLRVVVKDVCNSYDLRDLQIPLQGLSHVIEGSKLLRRRQPRRSDPVLPIAESLDGGPPRIAAWGDRKS